MTPLLLFLDELIGLAAVVLIFSIPIIAIYTSYKLKSKRLDLAAGEGSNNSELKRQLGNMMNENELLRERMKALEQIVSELPQLSSEDRQRLRINIESSEMSLEEIEKQRLLDNNNYKL